MYTYAWYDRLNIARDFGAKECDNLSSVKLNLVFMILEVWSVVFALKPFLGYEPKYIIGGASFENIDPKSRRTRWKHV